MLDPASIAEPSYTFAKKPEMNVDLGADAGTSTNRLALEIAEITDR